MSQYARIPIHTSRRKKHRGLKIFLVIIGALLAIACIAFILNYNTVMLFFGKGNVNIPSTSSIEKALKTNNHYENIQTTSDGSGDTTVTAQSKDGAVNIKSVTDSSGKQNVEVQMDIKKMSGISSSKSLANLQAVVAKINQYLASVIDPNQLTGIESYVTRELITQYKSGQSTFSISNTFNSVQLHISGNFETKVVNVDVNT